MISTDRSSTAAPRRRIDGYAPIESYAPIGDGRTLVLVADDGAIDWMCLPELDGPSVFGALLDPAGGGRFELAPSVPFEVDRRYVERTNVLETTFRTADGSARLTDGVSRPAGESAPGRELVRQVEGLSGRVPFEWRVEPRFDYGSDAATFERRGGAHVAAHERTRIAVQAFDAGEPSMSHGAVGGRFATAEGSRALIALLGAKGEPILLSQRDALERRLAGTVEYWRRWVARSSYDGPWRDAVERSLLALALLIDDRTGAIAAAGTTSLPETIGGERNYDYRFAWARDLSFTLDALLRIGLEDVAHKSFTWLLGAMRHTHPRIDPIYRRDGMVLHGQERLRLPGYRLSEPVLAGNEAADQLQLGGFGDVLETAWMYTRQGGLLDADTGERIADVADLLARIWQREDAGLWELDDYAHYMSSKLSCWAAFDRVLQLAEEGQVPARHTGRWRTTRNEVRDFIERNLWSEAKRSYVQKSGSDALDAAALLAARRGFTDPHGERMNATIDAIRTELSAGGPLLYRYSGMHEKENAFLACSFWCVEALAMAGRLDEAASTMDALVALATDVGLYAEEMDPSSRRMRGNVPQALTHLALVNAAALFEQSREELST